ncbi:MAG: hypothetical protein D8M61_17890 [Ignavibacteriae bacterium]|nr:hypothetical protein [Ignavibacteriota bacterium]
MLALLLTIHIFQPFSHSAIQPFSHSAIQPFSHSTISTIQMLAISQPALLFTAIYKKSQK